MTTRGALIVFEGLDRSGKSTQARKLVDSLNANGTKAELIAFPDRKGLFGQDIDRYLRKEIDIDEEALHLGFSMNRWAKRKEILEKVTNGTYIICDRYCFSGVAYSLAKGLDSNWVRQPDVGLPKPDVVLFFEVSPDVARMRGGFGDERLETEELQRKVRLQMSGLRKDYWQTVNADLEQTEVEREVQKIVNKLKLDEPLGKIDEI